MSKTFGSLLSFDASSPNPSIIEVAAPGTFTNPTALALGPDGNLYVGDGVTDSGEGIGRISRYSPSQGRQTVVELSGTSPSFSGGPVAPAAIAFRPGGQGGGMLVGRNPLGVTWVGQGYQSGPILEVSGWAVGGTAAVQGYTTGVALDSSPGLAVAPDGTLFVSNASYVLDPPSPFPPLVGNVVAFGTAGDYQAVVTSATSGLAGPTGLALSGSSLFVASVMNGNVYKTSLADPFAASTTSEFASAGGDYLGPLALLADGTLLAGSVGGSGIYEFGPAGGSPLRMIVGSEYGQIGGIAAVPEPATLWLVCGAATCFGLRGLRRRRA